MPEKRKPVQEEDSKPPVFKTWAGWYLLVIGNLIFLIIVFYLFTLYYK